MGNAILLFVFLSIFLSAILIGRAGDNSAAEQTTAVQQTVATQPTIPTQLSIVPDIGSIEVLNGCGVEGAANRMAELLRSKQFDVKNIDNASSWNYPFTLVVSRSKDMTVAKKIARVLKTDRVILIRTNEQTYDVTVIIGPEFGEKIL